MKKRALISVSDKRGAAELAAKLVKLGYEIVSTGGTARELKNAGIEVTGVSEITGYPECLDGRVKTLHPAVHAGLLAVRSNEAHIKQLEKLKIGTIDVVAVNLYPFKETILKPDVSFEEAVENIDIGGPAMLRSAAKNYQDVLVLTDPADYLEAVGRLKSGTADKDYRLMLMYKAFQHTATYDTLIADYLRKKAGITYPDQLTAAFVKKQNLRYGENPHQSAAFYGDILPVKGSLASAKQLQGKELSFNNINDAGAALELLREFSGPAAVAVKHTNPCGCAEGENVYDAYCKAYECDPVSIYGGIVAVNREVDEKLAAELVKIFLEILIAPSFTQGALGFLKVKPNLRVLKIADMDSYTAGIDLKKVSGGLLVQSRDVCLTEELTVVTKTRPSEQQLRDMLFAYRIVKHVKSNAIVLAADGAAVGIGEGQTNRIWAAKQAIEHAGEKAKGSVMASDAFFPFADCVEAAAAGGITAIIQPGGSIRDNESIEACDRHGIAMVFTDCRHFKH